jgi:hypothetical protein
MTIIIIQYQLTTPEEKKTFGKHCKASGKPLGDWDLLAVLIEGFVD